MGVMANAQLIAAGGGALRRAADTVLDALLPPQCLGCGAAVERPGRLCGGCWGAIDFIAGPTCAACGLPFDHDLGEDALCGECSRRRPAYGRARAVMRYTEASRRVVLAFKHGDRTDAAPSFAAWMARAGADLVETADLVAPVPLHRRRLFARRYNQAALLAHGLGRATGRAVVADLLVRTRPTPSQGGLSPSARRRNVRGAFAVHRGRLTKAAGRRVLLIDDVMTTGATVEACARTLMRAGAGAVDVLVLARVVRSGSGLI